MRLHLRLVALCTVAVIAAGCANNDKDTSPLSGQNSQVAPTLQCTVDIGDRIWFDVNCNGIQDKDETGGPEGIKVTLINCNDTNDKHETITDTDGNYLFDDVEEGEYMICIEIPGGFEASPEDVGDSDGLDSDINSEGCTGCRLYECDKPDYTRDAGLCEKKGEDHEGCTPGFWRNHLTHWAATPYSPTDKVNETFGCHLVSNDNLTLGTVIDAPQTYGALAFHAIAGLLNATHPDVDYGLTADEVIDLACAGDKDAIASENEEGCPLSGGNTTGGGGGKK